MKMYKAVPGLLTVALCIGASATAMYAQGRGPSVFVMTNDNAKNEILTYQRSFNGEFILADRVATGGRGAVVRPTRFSHKVLSQSAVITLSSLL